MTAVMRTALCVALCLALAACGQSEEAHDAGRPRDTGPPAPPAIEIPEAPPLPETPLGLEAVPVPTDNAQTAQKVFLGRQLFWDKRLSKTQNYNCVSCHLPEKAWTDGRPRAVTHDGTEKKINSPGLLNVGYRETMYWNGRTPNLEKQAMLPVKGFMGLEAAEAAQRIGEVAGYREQFRRVFGSEEVTPERMSQAIAAWERAMLSGAAPVDRFAAGTQDAMGEAARRGHALFTGKAGCGGCHSGSIFSDGVYHNIGVGYVAGEPWPADRFDFTHDEADKGKYRTPSLRNVALTAPYFHDGSAATLEDAVDFVLGGGKDNPGLDRQNLRRVRLTDAERGDLLAFLREGLTSTVNPPAEAPWIP